MDEQQIFNEFTDTIGHIVLYARAAKKLTSKELEELEKQTESYNKRKEVYPDWFSSFDKMYYHCPKSGETKLYYNCEDSLQDRKNKVWLHRNKNYQWLLAEAYEAYEIFLRKIYAYVGSINPSHWPLSDFGDAKLNELENKGYEWYLQQANKKRNDFPNSVLKELRSLLPQIEVFEKSNKNEINLRVVLKTIEKFRHSIVHQGGKINDLNLLITKIKDECKVPKTSPEARTVETYVIRHTQQISEQTTIVLIERGVTGLPNEFSYNRFETLIQYMVSYCALLAEEVESLS